MLKVTPLDRILFDPVSYIHPARFKLPSLLRGEKSRSLLNDMLINQYHLSTEQPLIVGFTQQLIARWHYLPQISFLIACQRHRAILSRQGVLQRFPAWIQQFAKLNLVAALPCQINQHVNFIQLLADGAREMGLWHDQLPRSLRQRILLLFPPDIDSMVQKGKSIDSNALLITLAMQHVKKYPHALEDPFMLD
ncbi:type III secretion apparatus protein OrgA/MxiK [Candidatus Regiella endosymbiont of Tuberolachnus salignus]|uniref:type III secretion apparatus protein OrgA/MxiK n=1 Tax=Candidatus Regiella endosymbiont of Tuberolachnus salignus TaxID=3077956 RepID=UPI0030D1F88F